jgi:hypothetical protein
MNPQTPHISNLDYLRKLLSGTLTLTDKSPFEWAPSADKARRGG